MESIKRYKNSHVSGFSKIELINTDWVIAFPEVGDNGYLKSYIQRKTGSPWAIRDEIDSDSLSLSEQSKNKKAGQFLATKINYDVSVPNAETEQLLNERAKIKFIAVLTDNNGIVTVYGSLLHPLSFTWSKTKSNKPGSTNKYKITLNGVNSKGAVYYWNDLEPIPIFKQNLKDYTFPSTSDADFTANVHPYIGDCKRIRYYANELASIPFTINENNETYRLELTAFAKLGQFDFVVGHSTLLTPITSQLNYSGKNLIAFNFTAGSSPYALHISPNTPVTSGQFRIFVSNLYVTKIITEKP